MKEIVEKKLVEKEEVKFIADDGKEFIVGDGYEGRYEAERACIHYEHDRNRKALEEKYERLVIDNLKINNTTVGWFCPDTSFADLIHLENKQDLFVAIDYNRGDGEEDYTEIKNFNFPCNAVMMGNIYSWVECRPANTLLKTFEEFKQEGERFYNVLKANTQKEDEKEN